MPLWLEAVKSSIWENLLSREYLDRWWKVLLKYRRDSKMVTDYLDGLEDFREELYTLYQEAERKDIETLEEIFRKTMNARLDLKHARNRDEVIFAFGRLYHILKPELCRLVGGLDIDDLQFKRNDHSLEITSGSEKMRVAFEVNSKDFRGSHPGKGKIDMIICWKHDWDNCPLTVLELSELTIYEKFKKEKKPSHKMFKRRSKSSRDAEQQLRRTTDLIFKRIGKSRLK